MRIRFLALTLILNLCFMACSNYNGILLDSTFEIVVYGSSIVLIYNLFSRLSVIKSKTPFICKSP